MMCIPGAGETRWDLVSATEMPCSLNYVSVFCFNNKDVKNC